jgi:DNA-directed RNA polymerase specialized sigma24 family protein
MTFMALLTHIVACRAVNQIIYEFGTQKRGSGQITGGAVFDVAVKSGREAKGSLIGPSCERSPLEEALLNDFYEYYVGALPARLRGFAELYLAGFTHAETAERMRCSLRSVERKVALILEKWREKAADSLIEQVPT